MVASRIHFGRLCDGDFVRDDAETSGRSDQKTGKHRSWDLCACIFCCSRIKGQHTEPFGSAAPANHGDSDRDCHARKSGRNLHRSTIYWKKGSLDLPEFWSWPECTRCDGNHHCHHRIASGDLVAGYVFHHRGDGDCYVADGSLCTSGHS